MPLSSSHEHDPPSSGRPATLSPASPSSSPPPPSPSGRTPASPSSGTSATSSTPPTVHPPPDSLRDLPFSHAPLTFLLHAAIIKLFGRVYYPAHPLRRPQAGATATSSPGASSSPSSAPSLPTHGSSPPSSPRPSPSSASTPSTPTPSTTATASSPSSVALYLLNAQPTAPSATSSPEQPAVLPLLQAKHRPALSPHHPRGRRSIAIIRRLQRTTIAPQLWLFAGASPPSPPPPHHPDHRRPAQLPLLDHHLRRPAPPARPRPHPQHLPPDRAPLDHPRRHRRAHPPPPQPTAGQESHRYPPPRRPIPLDHRLPFLAHSNDPSDRADQLLSLWPHLLILAPPSPSTISARETCAPTPPSTPSSLSSFSPLSTAPSSPSNSGDRPTPSGRFSPSSSPSCSPRSPPSPDPSPPSSPQPSSSAAGLYAISHERLSYIQLDGPNRPRYAPRVPRPRHSRPLDPRLRRARPLHQHRNPRQRRHPPHPRRGPLLLRHRPHPAVPHPALRPRHRSLHPAADPRPGPHPQHPLAHRQPQPATQPAHPTRAARIRPHPPAGLHPCPHPHQLRHLPPQVIRPVPYPQSKPEILRLNHLHNSSAPSASGSRSSSSASSSAASPPSRSNTKPRWLAIFAAPPHLPGGHHSLDRPRPRGPPRQQHPLPIPRLRNRLAGLRPPRPRRSLPRPTARPCPQQVGAPVRPHRLRRSPALAFIAGPTPRHPTPVAAHRLQLRHLRSDPAPHLPPPRQNS